MSEFITKVVVAADNQTAPALNAATKGIQNYAKAATAAQSQVRGASRQSRAALQQLGYQVQDISVQLQAGQSPFVVLAQQGSQVASIFGPGGAVLGALIAVGGAIAGSLLPNLFKGADSLDEMRQKAKDLGYELGVLAPLTASLLGSEDAKENAENLKQLESQVALIEALNELIAETEAVPETGTIAGLPQPLILQQYKEDLEAARLEVERLGLAVRSGGEPKFEARGYNAPGSFLYELEQRGVALERVKEIMAATQTPLQRLNQLEAEYNKLNQQGYLIGGNYLAAMADIVLQREALNKKTNGSVKAAKDEVDVLKERYTTTNSFMVAYEKYLAQQERGAELTKSVISPLETLQANAQEYLSLLNAGALTQETFNRLIEENGKKYESAIGYTEAAKSALAKYAEEAQNLDEQLKGVAMGGINSIEEGFIDLISGSKSVADSFKSMARSIVNDLIKIQVQRSITGPLAGMMEDAGGIGGIFNKIFGGARASGGPVQSGKAYLVGENGPELMMPSNSGYVVNNEDLTSGGSSEGVTIVNNISVSTGVQQTVRAEIQNLLPQITQATKQAVADSRQRGGGFSKALVGA